jgi:hypothetical protein
MQCTRAALRACSIIIASSAMAMLVGIIQELVSQHIGYVYKVLPLPLPLWPERLTSVAASWYNQGPGQLVLGGIRLTCCCYIFCRERLYPYQTGICLRGVSNQLSADAQILHKLSFCTLTYRIGIGCQLINTIPPDEDKLVDLHLPEWIGLIRSQCGK